MREVGDVVFGCPPFGIGAGVVAELLQLPLSILGCDKGLEQPLLQIFFCHSPSISRSQTAGLSATLGPVKTLGVERLAAGDYANVRPLLVELHLGEQTHYSDHPQLSRGEIENHLSTVPSTFAGENVIYAVRDDAGHIIGFSWIVLFDPGTGLEGEVAEVYVSAEHRGQGVGELLMAQAVSLFKDRGVTLGYVWTRPDNEAAVRLYRAAGFEPNRQLVLTWYPTEANRSS
jgi:ribosomal protein S18 acetylase RimI-like enzyme